MPEVKQFEELPRTVSGVRLLEARFVESDWDHPLRAYFVETDEDRVTEWRETLVEQYLNYADSVGGVDNVPAHIRDRMWASDRPKLVIIAINAVSGSAVT